MQKNILLECVYPVTALKFLVKASNISRNKFFSDAGIYSSNGYNYLNKNKTIASNNWYQLIARLPEPLYQYYSKLITRVHKNTILEGTILYDTYMFHPNRNITPHPVNDVLIYLTSVYNIDIDQVSYHSGLAKVLVKAYVIDGSQKPRLDKLWVLLSGFPYPFVLEFEWFMRNVRIQDSLEEYKYIRSVV